jgi:hypothetical protein
MARNSAPAGGWCTVDALVWSRNATDDWFLYYFSTAATTSVVGQVTITMLE